MLSTGSSWLSPRIATAAPTITSPAAQHKEPIMFCRLKQTRGSIATALHPLSMSEPLKRAMSISWTLPPKRSRLNSASLGLSRFLETSSVRVWLSKVQRRLGKQRWNAIPMPRIKRLRQRRLTMMYGMKRSRDGVAGTVLNGSGYNRQSYAIMLQGLWMWRRPLSMKW